MNKRITVLSILLALSILFTISSRSIFAFSLHTIADEVKNIFITKEDKNSRNNMFTIESEITLSTDGDENRNNKIDAGDIVRFTYTFTNTTDTSYAFSTLKTNVDSKSVSFIHNIHGTTGIDNNGKTIEIPHIRTNKGETLIISFDALINYFKEDTLITTEAEFIDSSKKPVVKAEKVAVIAGKLSEKEINERGVTIKKQ